MNLEITKIINYLNTTFGHLPGFQDSFANISANDSGVPLVSSLILAYDFDLISDDIYMPYNVKHKSADALYFKDEMYLIEFKRGFNSRNRNLQQAIKNDISTKISSSLHTLEKIIFQNSNADVNAFNRNFILVIDSSPTGNPVASISNVLQQQSNMSTPPFSNYILPRIANTRMFFDNVFKINDINFSNFISSLI